MKLLVAIVASYSIVVQAQNYCDDAHGAHCPEHSGWEVGECLSKIDESLQGEKCHDFILLHETCKVDLDKHCAGKEYSGRIGYD